DKNPSPIRTGTCQAVGGCQCQTGGIVNVIIVKVCIPERRQRGLIGPAENLSPHGGPVGNNTELPLAGLIRHVEKGTGEGNPNAVKRVGNRSYRGGCGSWAAGYSGCDDAGIPAIMARFTLVECGNGRCFGEARV